MADRYWVGGSASWDATAGTKWALTSGGAGGQAVPTASDDVFIDSGSGAVTVTVAASSVCRNLSFTSGAGAFAGTFTGTSALAISGNFTLVAGMTYSYTGALTFNSTTSQTITSAGKAINNNVTFNGAGGSWALQDNVTVSSGRVITLTAGTIDLNDKILSVPTITASNTNVRGIAFGTSGKCVITTTSGNAWLFTDSTNASFTGTTRVEFTPPSTSTSRNVYNSSTAGFGETNTVNMYFTTGTDTINFRGRARVLDFTGFTGTLSSAVQGLIVYGDFTLNSGMTIAATTFGFSLAGSSGTQSFTSNGVTIDAPLLIESTGATVTLVDNAALAASRRLTLTSGTLNLAGKTFSANQFVSTGTSSRTLNFGANGKVTIFGSGTTAWQVTGSNVTFSGTGTVDMTSASAKTFAGGSFTYPFTLNQGGTGDLTVSGNNTFYDVTATITATSAASILFTAGSTQTVTQFTASGASGKLLTLNSSSAGSTFTLSDSSGYNSVSYCSIKDSIATGGATWLSYTSNGNVDGGNNTGWDFSAPDVVSYTAPIQLRSFTERRRFS